MQNNQKQRLVTPFFLIKKLKNVLSSINLSSIKEQFINICKNINQADFGVHQSVIGLDMSDGVIRLVKFRRKQGHFELEMYLTKELPSGALVNNQLKDPEKAAETFRELFAEVGQSGFGVAIAIPRSLSIIKTFLIDKRLNDDEIESRAWIEAEHHFPNLINSIYLDFFVSGEVKENTPQLEVTLVASRKEHVKPYLTLAKANQIEIDLIDVDCYALSRATRLLDLDEKSTFAMINLGKSISSLIVMHRDQLIFSHDQSFNGTQLLNNVENFFQANSSINAADVTQLLSNPQYQAILRENVVSHINHSIHFLYASRPDITIDQLVISGECALVTGVSQFIQEETSMVCDIARHKILVETEGAIGEKEFLMDAPKTMLCCGLAMSQLEA